jgi:hypothetical protein
MTRHRTTLWHRTTKALGKLWQGMITLPEDPRRADAKKSSWNDYPHFPPF